MGDNTFSLFLMSTNEVVESFGATYLIAESK